MKFSFGACVLAIVIASAPCVYSQDKADSAGKGEKNTLTSEKLDNEAKNLDSIIKNLNEKIQSVVQKYKMVDNKDIKVVPYQVDYDVDKDCITMERHVFVRSDGPDAKVIEEKRKTIKLYVSGGTLTKVVSIVYERDYNNATEQIAEVVDSSPMSGNTDGIAIKQTFRKKVVFSKTLGEMKNTTAFPVRNDFKRDFYIPQLTYFYNTILSIAETYSKSTKDTDQTVADFLKASTRY
ncbi:MAG TPA: hypothetical protein PKK43_06710 [Spirochaetota bacterium]|nr:hypothetical protein [Spirochaetota bacterium]